MKQDFLSWFNRPTFALFQHRGGVRPSRGRRGHVQSESSPSQEPEGAGGGGEDHTSQPRDETRDLVWADHELVDLNSGPRRAWRGGGVGHVVGPITYNLLKSFL